MDIWTSGHLFIKTHARAGVYFEILLSGCPVVLIGFSDFVDLLCDEVDPVGLFGCVFWQGVEPCTQGVYARYPIRLEGSPHLASGDIDLRFIDTVADHGVDVLVGKVAPHIFFSKP